MATTYEPIATTTLVSSTSTITFSSIPNTYTDLRLVLVATAATSGQNVFYRFNGITTTTYSSTHLYGSTTAGSGRATSQTYIYANFAGNLSTTIPTMWTMDVFSYASSTHKTALLTSAQDLNGSGYVTNDVGLWRSTDAINSISIVTDSGGGAGFVAGTTATLYGIKAA